MLGSFIAGGTEVLIGSLAGMISLERGCLCFGGCLLSGRHTNAHTLEPRRRLGSGGLAHMEEQW